MLHEYSRRAYQGYVPSHRPPAATSGGRVPSPQSLRLHGGSSRLSRHTKELLGVRPTSPVPPRSRQSIARIRETSRNTRKVNPPPPPAPKPPLGWPRSSSSSGVSSHEGGGLLTSKETSEGSVAGDISEVQEYYEHYSAQFRRHRRRGSSGTSSEGDDSSDRRWEAFWNQWGTDDEADHRTPRIARSRDDVHEQRQQQQFSQVTSQVYAPVVHEALNEAPVFRQTSPQRPTVGSSSPTRTPCPIRAPPLIESKFVSTATPATSQHRASTYRHTSNINGGVFHPAHQVSPQKPPVRDMAIQWTPTRNQRHRTSYVSSADTPDFNGLCPDKQQPASASRGVQCDPDLGTPLPRVNDDDDVPRLHFPCLRDKTDHRTNYTQHMSRQSSASRDVSINDGDDDNDAILPSPPRPEHELVELDPPERIEREVVVTYDNRDLDVATISRFCDEASFATRPLTSPRSEAMPTPRLVTPNRRRTTVVVQIPPPSASAVRRPDAALAATPKAAEAQRTCAPSTYEIVNRRGRARSRRSVLWRLLKFSLFLCLVASLCSVIYIFLEHEFAHDVVDQFLA